MFDTQLLAGSVKMQLSCGEPHMQLKQPSGINELRVQHPAYDSRMNLQYG